jgi:hypothetical protein
MLRQRLMRNFTNGNADGLISIMNKTKIKKILYLSLGAWLLLCFVAGVFCFVTKPYLRSYYTYGQKGNPHTDDEVRYDITKVIDGDIYGTISVKIRSKEIKQAIDDSEMSFVQYENMYDNPQVGDWIRVGNIEKKFNEYVLTSDSERTLSKQYDSESFPFDQYYVWFAPSFIALNKQRNVICEKHISNGTINFQLPRSFSIEEGVINPVRNKKAENDEFLFKIKRQSWYLWFLGGLAGLLLIPVLILLSSDAKSMSIDVVALLLAFVSARTYLLGESKEVYVLDIIICLLALISGLIIIYNLYHREDETKQKGGAGKPHTL